MEKTLVIIKPDAMEANLASEIISRLEKAGLKITSQKRLTLSKSQAEKLYREHKGKNFYEGLVRYMTSAPVILMVAEGKDAVTRLRKLMGPTDPRKAEKGTIRGDLKAEPIVNQEGIIRNLIHGSDSKAKAEEEIAIFF